MPKFRLMHEKSRMTLEQIADRFTIVIDTDTPHPKIRHIGDLSAEGNSMEGTWLSAEFSLGIPGSSQSIALPKMAGVWKVTRS
jgi:hypothetical protein